jgi:flagellar basal body-associated protein FliL
MNTLTQIIILCAFLLIIAVAIAIILFWLLCKIFIKSENQNLYKKKGCQCAKCGRWTIEPKICKTNDDIFWNCTICEKTNFIN